MIQYQLLKTNIQTHLTLIRRAKVPPAVIDYLKEPSDVINDSKLVSFICFWVLFNFVAGISWQLAFGQLP